MCSSLVLANFSKPKLTLQDSKVTAVTDSIKLKKEVLFDKKENEKHDTIPSFFVNEKPEKRLYEALIYYDIKNPDIVYAQAVLETGNFKSKGCVVKNNLFGLMKGKKLRSFNHWIESVIFYRDHIQNRYKGGDYYQFLTRIHYASAHNYTAMLRKIVNQTAKKRKENKCIDFSKDSVLLIAHN